MLRVDLDLCSGCKRCMLACAFYRSGGFNPRYSSIDIKTDIAHKPLAYAIKDCFDCNEHYCSQFCPQDAIEVLP